MLLITNVVCYAAHEQSVIRSRLAWLRDFPTNSLVSNRAAQRCSAPSTYWLFDQLDPGHLVQSYVLNETSLLLLRAGELGFFILTIALEAWTGKASSCRGSQAAASAARSKPRTCR